ncbi:3-hydroxyacyl-[acyl-carrier-protein] dehydratase FabZ [Buchnera aphidicola (Eriosoma lanigerum)]|uniref:3-hydroxyacyl-ACP dehydratase FabZ n=1 Tax=Buchnera aphidicola TaxID=9 RepID=UPI003463908C
MKIILDTIQHRYPFLLVDRILKFIKNNLIVAIKNVTINESYFQGHFPIEKIVPGVLMIESIAQTAGIFLSKNNESTKLCKPYYLVGIDKTKFKQFVVPGDQMIITVVLDKSKKGFYIFKGIITVDNKMVCKSTLTCMNYN